MRAAVTVWPMSTHEPRDLHSSSSTDAEDAAASPACVLVFNASDPSGAGGLAAAITAIASIGAHALPVVTGAYVRDSAEVFEHVAFDDEAVTEQARTVLEDIPVQVIEVGFVGSPDNLAAIASLASDYADVPLIAYMPDLSWWDEAQIDLYLDAFRELMLPQTTVLVGNHSTLSRWLLPDWSDDKRPSARDLARAAADGGVAYTLVTGIAVDDQHIDNVLASPQAVLASGKFERFDAQFCGAGDTLAAALAALIATGSDLAAATGEALSYLDQSLDGGFRPGMGNLLPDRLFWAQGASDDAADDADETPTTESEDLQGFAMPPHETKH